MKPKTKQGHTLGPWQANGDEVIAIAGGFIADCCNNHASGIANARLIAASPQLLEACKNGLTFALEYKKQTGDNSLAEMFMKALGEIK